MREILPGDRTGAIQRYLSLLERINRLALLKGKIGRELVEQNPAFLRIVPANLEDDKRLTNLFLDQYQRLRMRRIAFVIQGRAKQASKLEKDYQFNY